MPDQGPTINANTGLLRIERGGAGWRVAGTVLNLARFGNGDDAIWVPTAASMDVSAWLDGARLRNVSCARRRDLLRALTAAHHQEPIPAHGHTRVRLRRHPTMENMWVASHSDANIIARPAEHRGYDIKIHHTDSKLPFTLVAATLRDAERRIGYHFQHMKEQKRAPAGE